MTDTNPGGTYAEQAAYWFERLSFDLSHEAALVSIAQSLETLATAAARETT